MSNTMADRQRELEYWDAKALLLRMLDTHLDDTGPIDLVEWLHDIASFTEDSKQPSYRACAIIGVEPSVKNRQHLARACARLLGRQERPYGGESC